MVKETTIICIDTSDYMGHHDSPKYLAQLDALELYLQLILKPHSDHYVGVYGLAWPLHVLILEPTNTNDISDIMTIVRRSQKCMKGDIINLDITFPRIMDKHEHVLTRMVVFIGGPLLDDAYNPYTYSKESPNTYGSGKYNTHMSMAPRYTCLGTRFKKMGVAVDVINFGTQQEGFKKHALCVFLAAANNNNNTRMLDRSGHHDLDASSFLALAGNGRTGMESVLLMQGDDFQTAIDHFLKVNKPTGPRFYYPKEKQDDKGREEGGETYRDQGDRYDRKQDDGGNDDTRDRKRKRFDRVHDEGRETYWDRGDHMSGRKRDYKGHDEERAIYQDRGDRHDQKQDDRANHDTRDRKRKCFDKGHDEGRETYWDRGDRYGRKRDYKGHDEERAIYRDRGDRDDQKQDDTTSRCFRIRLSVDISSNSSIREARGHDEGRKRHRDRGYGHGRRQDDNMMMVGKDIGIEVMGMAENKIIEVMLDGKYIGIEVIGMAEKRDYNRGLDEWKDAGMKKYEPARDEKSSCASSRS